MSLHSDPSRSFTSCSLFLPFCTHVRRIKNSKRSMYTLYGEERSFECTVSKLVATGCASLSFDYIARCAMSCYRLIDRKTIPAASVHIPLATGTSDTTKTHGRDESTRSMFPWCVSFLRESGIPRAGERYCVREKEGERKARIAIPRAEGKGTRRE